MDRQGDSSATPEAYLHVGPKRLSAVAGRVTAEDRVRVERAAAALGVTMSQFVAATVSRAAREFLENAATAAN